VFDKEGIASVCDSGQQLFLECVTSKESIQFVIPGSNCFLECVRRKESLQFVIPGSNCFFGVCDMEGNASVCDTGQQLFFWSV